MMSVRSPQCSMPSSSPFLKEESASCMRIRDMTGKRFASRSASGVTLQESHGRSADAGVLRRIDAGSWKRRTPGSTDSESSWSDMRNYLKATRRSSISLLRSSVGGRWQLFTDKSLELLALAPTAMDTDAAGRPKWNHNVTAAVLLETCLEHARRLGNVAKEPAANVDNDTMQRDEEAKTLFSRLANVLLNRDDGMFLAVNWLCHLVSIGEPPRQHVSLWSPTALALETVASSLGARKVGLSEFDKTFPELFIVNEKKLEDLRQTGLADLGRYATPSGMDALQASLWIALSSAEMVGAQTRDTFLKRFETLLIRQDSGLRIFRPEDGPPWRQWHISYLYATDTSPADAWRRTWDLLAEQRRLSRHCWFMEKASQADNPSFFVATVGVLLVDWTLSPDIRRVECTFPAWNAVFEGVYCAVVLPFVEAPASIGPTPRR